MIDEGIIGEGPTVRVSAGGESRPQGRELLRVIRDADTSVATAAVGSTGHVELEPLVMATFEGRTAFFPRPPTERVKPLLKALDNESLPTDEAMTVADHELETATLPIPKDGPLAVSKREVLGTCGWAVPTSITDYTESLNALLAEHATNDSETVRERIEESGLRGRGRGDASGDGPVAEEWKTVREAVGDPVVVVNGNETDDHAAGDRLLLESAPLAVLDSALATGVALDATDVIVYTNENETLARERVQEAANALHDAADTEVTMQVVAGPDEYKAGEPTMALEAIEGNHRLEARRTPPGPSEHGVDGRPTLIHTPRTFVQIGRVLVGDGPVGAESDPGTRLFTLAGDVNAPATVELSTGTTLDTALPAVEIQDGRKVACVGGVFGGVTRSLDVPASVPGLSGARLGTNGVVELFGNSTCTVALVGERAKFAREANCGRCVPCREGSKQLVELLRDVYNGEFKDGMLRELARVMRETSICGFGQDASRPVTTAMEAFETEFNAHTEGRCPAGVCDH